MLVSCHRWTLDCFLYQNMFVFRVRSLIVQGCEHNSSHPNYNNSKPKANFLKPDIQKKSILRKSGTGTKSWFDVRSVVKDPAILKCFSHSMSQSEKTYPSCVSEFPIHSLKLKRGNEQKGHDLVATILLQFWVCHWISELIQSCQDLKHSGENNFTPNNADFPVLFWATFRFQKDSMQCCGIWKLAHCC